MGRIMVIGIGGVGGYMASLLSKHYQDVTLVARGERYESLKQNGLSLSSDLHGDFTTHPNVVDEPLKAGKQDYIFICVKNYSLREVLEQIKPCIKDDTIIIPVLNGVNHGEICEEVLAKGYVVNSLIYIVSFFKEDYSIVQQGETAYLYVGGKHEEKNQRVCDLMNEASIDCALSDYIERELWTKYILNCAYNTLTAYYNCTNIEIKVSNIRCHEYKELLKEAYNVALAKGIILDENLVEKHYNEILYNQPENATSSLSRDIQKHRRNELETFSGYLVEEAKKYGVSVPQTTFFHLELKRKSI